METNNSFIAVNNAAPETAGAIVWWRLEGTADHTRLCDALLAIGIVEDDLPKLPTPAACLRRAVDAFEVKYRTFARKHPKEDKWVLWDEYVNTMGDVLHGQIAAAHLDAEGLRISSNTLEQEEFLRASFASERTLIHAVDISGWLVRRMTQFTAVALRPSGGIYFLPQPSVYGYHRISQALAQVTAHKLYEVPALRSEEAVQAILDALRIEAQDELTAITTAMQAGTLGKRAIENRQEACNALLGKVRTYEALLGVALAEIPAAIQQLEASLTLAALAEMPALLAGMEVAS